MARITSLASHVDFSRLEQSRGQVDLTNNDKFATIVITSKQLPDSWRDPPAPLALAAVGYEWLKTGRTAMLSVPSAVIPVERNFLLNPAHPDLAQIQIHQLEVFGFDIRLR